MLNKDILQLKEDMGKRFNEMYSEVSKVQIDNGTTRALVKK